MKIFLGYASEHVDVARDVYAFLKISNEVWFDKDSLLPGVDWDRERSGGQDEAELIVHLVSREIIERKGVVNREIKQTLRLAEDQPFGALFVVFIRVEDFRLPVELTRFQYVDYFAANWRDRLQESLNRRERQLQRPSGQAVPRKEVVSSQPATAGPTLFQFSDASERYECSGEYLTYPRVGLYWSMVNSRIQSTALEEFISMRATMRRFSIEDEEPSPAERGYSEYSWEMTCEEFFTKDDVVSVRFYSYHHLGGAHGNHHITSLTFLGEQHGLVDVRSLFRNDVEKAKRVLNYCKQVVVAGLEGVELADINTFVGEAEDAVWGALAQYNVDTRGLTFNFAPYVLLAYAYGSHEVQVPWSVCGDAVDEDLQELFDAISRPRAPRIVPV